MTDSRQEHRSWPGLDRSTAREAVAGFGDLMAPGISRIASVDHEKSAYPALGGRRAGTDSLKRLRADVLAVIDGVGCPDLQAGDKEQCRRADIEMAKVLHELPMSAR
ncbi:MAG: hypothetical protein GY895_19535, partial [Phycisphaera sp.]|nr:hypothetical protein [Phycisphaera sp.]